MESKERTELSKYVGRNIKQYRVKKKLTQKQLGDMLGKSHNTISNYETGTISPEQDALFAIAKALDVRLDDLFPPIGIEDKNNNFEKALELADGLDLEDMNFLLKLIEKTLSVEGKERERLLESMKFTIEYYDKMNGN